MVEGCKYLSTFDDAATKYSRSYPLMNHDESSVLVFLKVLLEFQFAKILGFIPIE